MSETDGNTSQFQSLQEENFRLKRAVEELSVLNELARAISASSHSEEVMQTIVRRSMRAVNAEQGVITLVDQQANDPMKTLVRAMVSTSEHEQFHLTQALVGWMHLNKKPLLLNSPRTDERFRGVLWDDDIRSLLCVPMMMKSELKGVLTLINKKEGNQFSEEDQRLLAIIAAQSAQVVENARLNEREKQLFKMQEEVRLAAKIQAELLPKEAPSVSGYDIAGESIPAQVVGGDYFDFISMDDSRIAICLGDVTGKGLPASLLMANVQATLRSQSFIHTSPKNCIERSNAFLYQSTSAEKFVTLFYGILDFANHTFSFSNAGHDHPFLFQPDQQPIRLKTGGIMLGMMETFPFQEETLLLGSNAVLVMYSDGIAEAMNPNQEQFGEQQIAEVLQTHRHLPAAEIVDVLMRAAKAHAGTAPQSDDMTIVVVKRLPN
jgi:sigma-B regulation protein RsbU (phosphoserine phosphatase)